MPRRVAGVYDPGVGLLIGRSSHPWWSLSHLPVLTWLGVMSTLSRLDAGHPPAEHDTLNIAIFSLTFVVPLLGEMIPRHRRWLWLAPLGVALALPGLRSLVGIVTWVVFGCAMSALMLPLTWPLIRGVRVARRAPETRSVALECAILGAYGLTISFGRLQPVEALWATRLLLAVCLATLAVALAGLTWDLVARAQVRAVLADQAVGWRATTETAPEDLPRITWLGPADAETRLLVRVAVTAGGAYRESVARERAIAVIPSRVRVMGAAGAVCGVIALATVALLART